MDILSKSNISNKQLNLRTKMVNKIELQILGEFLQGKTPRNIANELADYTPYVEAIHCPLYPGWEFNLENIESEKVKKNITDTCKLAQKIAERKMGRVYVVFHSGISVAETKSKRIWKDITSMFYDLVKDYPNVDFLIENLMPYKIDTKTNTFYFRNGSFHDAIEMVHQLGRMHGKERFGTTLDTAHAEVTCAFYKRILQEEIINIEQYFKDFRDTCKLIHLSDCIDIGLNGLHGIAFTKEREFKMKEYIDLYHKYNYNCDIVLEVREDNYDNPINFINNYELIKKYL